MKNLLSIDFDFFVRENPVWDFGHSEMRPIFSGFAWKVRYMSLNLWDECRMEKYADFMPDDILKQLALKGFKIKPNARLTVANSHLEAYPIITGMKRCNVYNLDAHHDLWNTPSLDCGSWLHYGMENGLVDTTTWIAPSWGVPFHLLRFQEEYTERWGERLKMIYYKDLRAPKDPIEINEVFVCRSSAWVPPHFDLKFYILYQELGLITGKWKFPEGKTCLLPREYVTEKECKAMVGEQNKIMKEMQDNIRKGSNG